MATLPELVARKETGEKIVGVVAWDYQMARIADRAGADLLVVGDSVGVNLWGHANPFEVTLDEMIVVAKAVKKGAGSVLVCCDFPYGPLQLGPSPAVAAAIRIVKETGADLVKLDGAGDHLEGVEAVRRAGVPVFAQMGITPQLALRYGVDYAALSKAGAQVPSSLADDLVAEAKRLESAGASMIDFTNSGPIVGPQVTAAVSIPVLGGFGGGPWLDGRVRMAHAAIGYAASGLDTPPDTPPDTYAQVAQVAHAALTAYAGDVRAGRQIKGGIRVADRGR
jgi:3-methyl-2-oxobutanoate hydroxymethyltransferase